ncbi:45498_t:CDS:2 [Gigaspora margarita]|uniref:45498_t:CDS:1 n=1 Tax=Gigaspora margarita TaxID=4874 RepID=A0ABN7UDT5_GIGMA|nr:45498_t:CDS:2 [Gigaspora margarita]
MQTAINAHSTQILTKKIKLETDTVPHISTKDRISEIFRNQKIHAISVYYDNSTSSKQSVLKRPYCPNGFAAAIFHAYNHHQHLRLSPDDIWLTISQGISRHINFNAEKFRNRFVKHEGKILIKIYAIDILSLYDNNTLAGNWPEVVNRLVIETNKYVEKIDLVQLLECDFSTTTSSSLAASRIVLLDAVKSYFDYMVLLLCGIPKVTLEVDTYRGKVDEKFWSNIISINSYGSGGEEVTGWISAFFPYDRKGEALHSNFIDLDDIPDGIVEVPFDTDIGLSLKFVAGFIGANQETLENLSSELVVSPVIGWAIVDNETDSSNMDESVLERQHHEL